MADTNMFYGATPEIFERARALRDNMTRHELMLWDRLRANQIRGIRFKSQHPIDQFIADFYCHKHKLIIEIDGPNHQQEEQIQYDNYREEIVKNLGLKVIRFTNEQVENDIEGVIKEIENLVDESLIGTIQKEIVRIERESRNNYLDTIAIESPLEIRIKKENQLTGNSIAVTMRTPGNDIELALGFIFTEGILKDFNDIIKVEMPEENVVEVLLVNESKIDLSQSDRNFYTTSSCGVCGKASIEAIKVDSSFSVVENLAKIEKSALLNLQEKLKAVQSAFEATGGIHASALFDLRGNLIELREDVGRHNALDKLIGYAWKRGNLPLSDHVVLLSGRASFELVQKASMAGIPYIVAVGAPSSLAVELAEENGHTLIGFLKSDRFNIYTGHERIKE